MLSEIWYKNHVVVRSRKQFNFDSKVEWWSRRCGQMRVCRYLGARHKIDKKNPSTHGGARLVRIGIVQTPQPKPPPPNFKNGLRTKKEWSVGPRWKTHLLLWYVRWETSWGIEEKLVYAPTATGLGWSTWFAKFYWATRAKYPAWWRYGNITEINQNWMWYNWHLFYIAS